MGVSSRFCAGEKSSRRAPKKTSGFEKKVVDKLDRAG